MSRMLVLFGILTVAGTIVGCSDKLETGYEPRRLGSSSAERRAYYASPYTPESIAAERSPGAQAGPSGFHHPGQ